MQLRSHFLKFKEKPAPQANSYSQHQPGKLFSRKKIIAPISPEAEIHTARAAQRPASHIVKKSQIKNLPHSQPYFDSKDTHLISSATARKNAHIRLAPLESRLDAKTRRNRRLVAFIAQVLFWAAVYYVFFL